MISPGHHCRSIRLPGFDFIQAGAYFVTLCTWKRACLFGDDVAGEVRLSAVGVLRQAILERALEWRR